MSVVQNMTKSILPQIYLMVMGLQILPPITDSLVLSVEVYITSTDTFNVHGSMHRKNILIYIQQDATLRRLSYLENTLHVSGGTSTNHEERKQMYL